MKIPHKIGVRKTKDGELELVFKDKETQEITVGFLLTKTQAIGLADGIYKLMGTMQ